MSTSQQKERAALPPRPEGRGFRADFGMTDRRWPEPEERKPLTRKQYAELYLRQDGRCTQCNQRLEIKGGEQVTIRDEHVAPLWRGGGNELSNRELWCLPCTKPKDAAEATDRAKGKRVRDKYIGAPVKQQRPQSKFKKKVNGTVVWRETGEPVR